MADFVDAVGQFDLRPDNPVLMLEERRQPADAHITIFIDGHANDRAAVLAVPIRIVGAAAK